MVGRGGGGNDDNELNDSDDDSENAPEALEGLCDDVGRHSAAMSVPCGRLADGPIWDVPGRPKKEGKC